MCPLLIVIDYVGCKRQLAVTAQQNERVELLVTVQEKITIQNTVSIECLLVLHHCEVEEL